VGSYFISNGESIVNFILADTKEIAEEVTQMNAISQEEAVEGLSFGWKFVNGLWINPNPAIIEEISEEIVSEDS